MGTVCEHGSLKRQCFTCELEAEVASLRDKLHEIKHWCAAYPLDIFPEPDFKKARELLEAGGMTIDAISASNMRHVTTGIQKIIDGGKA